MEKQGFFKKTPFEDNIDFGANWPPCWPPKSKIFQNYCLPRGLQNFIVFCKDFLSIWAPFWEPSWSHVACQDAPKRPQEPPKRPPDRRNFGIGFKPAWGRSKTGAAVQRRSLLQSAAQRGRRVRSGYEVFLSFRLSPFGFFFSEVLVFPLLNPPPVASGRLHLLRRSAALARLGGSWAEKIAFQEAFQNWSNFDALSTSIFEGFRAGFSMICGWFALFFSSPFLIANLLTPKTLGGGTPPRGASIIFS